MAIDEVQREDEETGVKQLFRTSFNRLLISPISKIHFRRNETNKQVELMTHPLAFQVSICPPPESWKSCLRELLHRPWSAVIIIEGTSESLKPETKRIGAEIC